jgi:hypothetical protein
MINLENKWFLKKIRTKWSKRCQHCRKAGKDEAAEGWRSAENKSNN